MTLPSETSYPREIANPRARPSFIPAFVVVAIALLGATALALLAVSFASYGEIKGYLDAYASDRDAAISEDDFRALVLRSRILAVCLLAAAAAIYLQRRRLERGLAALLGSFQPFFADLRANLSLVFRRERVDFFALLLVALAGLAAKLVFLFQPMRYDEATSFVHYASQPFHVALAAYTAPNNHLFHTFLVHVSSLLFGDAPWAVRLPALLAGVLLVPATYVAARMFYGRYAALAAAALVSSSSVLAEFSTNARGYTLLALVFVLLLALGAYVRRNDNAAAWLAFAVLGAIGFYTIPVMLYAFGTVVVWLVLSALGEKGTLFLLARRLALWVPVTAVLTFLLYAPVFAASGVGAVTRNEYVAPRTWSYLATTAPDSFLSLWRTWHRDLPIAIAIVLTIAFLVGTAFHARVSSFRVPPVAGALIWIIPVLAVQRVLPYERVWLFLLPLYLMTASAGLVYVVRLLGRWRKTARGSGIAVALGAVALATSLAAATVANGSVEESEETTTFRDGEQVTLFLKAHLEPGDRVLATFPTDSILEYYFRKEGLDPARILYSDVEGKRLFAVTKNPPRVGGTPPAGVCARGSGVSTSMELCGPERTLPYLVEENNLSRAEIGRPVVVRRFAEATVYEFRNE